MSGNNAQDTVSDLEIGIDCTPRRMTGDGEIDRICSEHWKVSQDRIAKAPPMLADAGCGDHPAAGDLAEIGPLVSLPTDAPTYPDLLQAGDVGVDLT
jgi:hypothetical protein